MEIIEDINFKEVVVKFEREEYNLIQNILNYLRTFKDDFD